MQVEPETKIWVRVVGMHEPPEADINGWPLTEAPSDKTCGALPSAPLVAMVKVNVTLLELCPTGTCPRFNAAGGVTVAVGVAVTEREPVFELEAKLPTTPE